MKPVAVQNSNWCRGIGTFRHKENATLAIAVQKFKTWHWQFPVASVTPKGRIQKGSGSKKATKQRQQPPSPEDKSMLSDDFLLLSDAHPQFSYGLPPLELQPATKPGPTLEEVDHDKQVLAGLAENLDEDPVHEPLRSFLTQSLDCPSCTVKFAPKDFPLRQGRCGHTICKPCYETHVRPPSAEWYDAKCPACKRTSFQGHGGINRVAMMATHYLGEAQGRFETEMRHLHSRWKSHVTILEKRHPPDANLVTQIKQLQEAVSERDKALEGLRETHKDRVRKMREHLSFADARSENAEAELKRTDKILAHLERGREYYYFICPNCGDHLEKIKRSRISDSLPTVQTCASVRPGLEVDDSTVMMSATTRAELFQSAGYKAMRSHLINHCIPFELGTKAKESELPAFYRHSAPSATNSDCLAVSKPKKKRKVSLEGDNIPTRDVSDSV